MQLSITDHAHLQWEARFGYLRIPLRKAVDQSVYIGYRNGRLYLYKPKNVVFVVHNGAIVTCYRLTKRSPRVVRELVAKHSQG